MGGEEDASDGARRRRGGARLVGSRETELVGKRGSSGDGVGERSSSGSRDRREAQARAGGADQERVSSAGAARRYAVVAEGGSSSTVRAGSGTASGGDSLIGFAVAGSGELGVGGSSPSRRVADTADLDELRVGVSRCCGSSNRLAGGAALLEPISCSSVSGRGDELGLGEALMGAGGVCGSGRAVVDELEVGERGRRDSLVELVRAGDHLVEMGACRVKGERRGSEMGSHKWRGSSSSLAERRDELGMAMPTVEPVTEVVGRRDELDGYADARRASSSEGADSGGFGRAGVELGDMQGMLTSSENRAVLGARSSEGRVVTGRRLLTRRMVVGPAVVSVDLLVVGSGTRRVVIGSSVVGSKEGRTRVDLLVVGSGEKGAVVDSLIVGSEEGEELEFGGELVDLWVVDESGRRVDEGEPWSSLDAEAVGEGAHRGSCARRLVRGARRGSCAQQLVKGARRGSCAQRLLRSAAGERSSSRELRSATGEGELRGSLMRRAHRENYARPLVKGARRGSYARTLVKGARRGSASMELRSTTGKERDTRTAGERRVVAGVGSSLRELRTAICERNLLRELRAAAVKGELRVAADEDKVVRGRW
ncbi:hypothetical protein N665_2458s0002 [Sinapis alba]|nr:hypothetical protein N665_2458s0002 [Sinapis alba]